MNVGLSFLLEGQWIYIFLFCVCEIGVRTSSTTTFLNM